MSGRARPRTPGSPPDRRRGFCNLVTLETPALTAAFWTSVALFVAAFWATPFPPLIDYPQHVAVGALLRRAADPASAERALYEVNLVTYNGGFHLAVAALSFVLPAEVAGKVLVSLYPPLLALAGLALVRVAGRPRWYALLLLPITYSFALGWGFANWALGVPIAMLAFTWWLRWHRGERAMLGRIAIASFVLAYTHVLATLCLCVAVAVAGLVSWPSLGRTWGARALALVRLPLPLWPALVWCTAVFVRNRYSPHANWEGWDDGLDDPLWYKLLHLTAYAVGNFSDASDQALLAVALALLILLWQSPEREGRGDPLMRTLALVWGAIYCVVPKVFIATWFIFERFPTWVLAFAIPATPIVRGRSTHWMQAVAACTALAAGASTVWHMTRIPGEADASAILDDIPAGRRVIAVTWANHGEPVVLRELWVHLLAYYQARRPGQIAYSFAKFESMPVHYRPGRAPPAVPGGMEWDAQKYDPDSPYGRFWTTVLVRTPEDAPDADPRAKTFGAFAADVTLRSHRGRFWLFER